MSGSLWQLRRGWRYWEIKKGRDKKENWDKSNWRLNLSLTSPFHTKLVWEIIFREAIRIYGNIWRPFGGRECRLLRSSSVSAFPGFFMKTFPTFSWSQWFAFTAFFTFSLYSFKWFLLLILPPCKISLFYPGEYSSSGGNLFKIIFWASAD